MQSYEQDVCDIPCSHGVMLGQSQGQNVVNISAICKSMTTRIKKMDTTCIDQKLQAKFKFSDRHQPDKINGLTERHSNQEKQKNEIEWWFQHILSATFFVEYFDIVKKIKKQFTEVHTHK